MDHFIEGTACNNVLTDTEITAKLGQCRMQPSIIFFILSAIELSQLHKQKIQSQFYTSKEKKIRIFAFIHWLQFSQLKGDNSNSSNRVIWLQRELMALHNVSFLLVIFTKSIIVYLHFDFNTCIIIIIIIIIIVVVIIIIFKL